MQRGIPHHAHICISLCLPDFFNSFIRIVSRSSVKTDVEIWREEHVRRNYLRKWILLLLFVLSYCL